MAAVALLDVLAVPIVLDDAVFFQRGAVRRRRSSLRAMSMVTATPELTLVTSSNPSVSDDQSIHGPSSRIALICVSSSSGLPTSRWHRWRRRALMSSCTGRRWRSARSPRRRSIADSQTVCGSYRFAHIDGHIPANPAQYVRRPRAYATTQHQRT
jgi:hypothetical protein